MFHLALPITRSSPGWTLASPSSPAVVRTSRVGIMRDLKKKIFAVLLNTTLLLASLLIGLVIAEVAIRWIAPQQLSLLRPDMWAPVDSVGWLPRPNVRTKVNTGERTVNFVTDQQGFRVARTGRVDSSKTILLLGDSFMEALQVEYEESLAGRIEKESARTLGTAVAIRNAGVGGWDPPQYLIRARQLLANARYDAVVVSIFTGNDIVAKRTDYVPPRAPAKRASFHFPTNFSRRGLVSSLLQPLNDFLEVRSQLYIFVRTKLHWIAVRTKLVKPYFPQVLRKAQAKTKRWDVTADILADLAREAKAKGTPVIFLLIPSNVQVYQERLAVYEAALRVDPATIDADQPNRLLAQRLALRGLVVLDALDAFRAAAGEGKQLFGNVDPHLTNTGHEVLWTVLRPSLARLLENVHVKKAGTPT